jgi:C-terminal processing protease CtpA/Prc
VLNGVIANLRESYVYPNVAREMINALLTHERNGDYENETTGSDFAALLTKHLQDVSHDLHLRVVYSATEVPPLGPPNADPNFQSMLERDNCAFRKVEVLPHNIGYVKFDAFAPASLCRDTAATAMRFLAHVDGLIFDLRENQGGDPHMVSFMASYLFDRRTHLNDIYSQLDKSTEEFWTSEDVAGPKFGKKPVYVLTSAGTFSGAEEFTYDLKNLKRAVVVGETTAGGAHLVMMHRIDAHFIIGVPFARPINPISKTDWEGTGVAPDVPVKSADALDAAKQLAMRKLEHNQE